MITYSQKWMILGSMVLLSILTLVIDSVNPAWIGGGVPYILVVALGYFIKNRRITLYSAIATSLLLLGGIQLGAAEFHMGNSMIYRLWILCGIWGMAALIHQMKVNADQLKRNESHLSALFEAATEGIIISDRRGVVLSVNKRAEELFGYDREEIIGDKVESLMPQRYTPRHQGYRRDYYDHPEPRPMGQGRELYAKRKNGEEFPVEISLNHFETNEGRFYIAFVIDITYRKQAEEQLLKAHNDLKRKANELKQSNSELEQFAYVASHDLQEPLRMVASYTQLLARRYQNQLDQDAQDFIEYAVDGANRMQQLINDLLEYSRVGTHGRELVPSDLNLIFDIAKKHLETLIEEQHARITIQEDMPQVIGDEIQLIQLFQNLLHNAIKFRAEHRPPEIKIWSEEDEDNLDTIIIHVADNGIGIEPNHQKRIFMIFQRLHNRNEYPGSGIGLAVSKKIVERHNGRIWLDSTPGEGTTFHVALPKATNQQEIIKERTDAKKSTR
ncbi:MAG: sensor histidine kinase [Bacteroidota bacterium]